MEEREQGPERTGIVFQQTQTEAGSGIEATAIGDEDEERSRRSKTRTSSLFWRVIWQSHASYSAPSLVSTRCRLSCRRPASTKPGHPCPPLLLHAATRLVARRRVRVLAPYPMWAPTELRERRVLFHQSSFRVPFFRRRSYSQHREQRQQMLLRTFPDFFRLGKHLNTAGVRTLSSLGPSWILPTSSRDTARCTTMSPETECGLDLEDGRDQRRRFRRKPKRVRDCL